MSCRLCGKTLFREQQASATPLQHPRSLAPLGLPAHFATLLSAAMLFGSVAGAGESRSKVAFREGPRNIAVTVAGQPIATYVFADDTIPRPYLAHLHGPGGVRLTRNFPPIEGKDRMDHATMHPGLWMAFGDLDGTDIWRNKGSVAHERFVQKPAAGPGHGSFAVRNRYETNDGKPICHETCRLTFLIRPHGYLLLWDSTFSSGQELYFGDQEEMGLGVRLATPIAVSSRAGGRILDSEGRQNERAVWGKTADWCDYSGPVNDSFAGITIMPDPDNFRPCWWHARDYGFMAANPFGQAAFRAGPPSRVGGVVKPTAALALRHLDACRRNTEQA